VGRHLQNAYLAKRASALDAARRRRDPPESQMPPKTPAQYTLCVPSALRRSAAGPKICPRLVRKGQGTTHFDWVGLELRSGRHSRLIGICSSGQRRAGRLGPSRASDGGGNALVKSVTVWRPAIAKADRTVIPRLCRARLCAACTQGYQCWRKRIYQSETFQRWWIRTEKPFGDGKTTQRRAPRHCPFCS